MKNPLIHGAALMAAVIIGIPATAIAERTQLSIATFNVEWLGAPEKSGAWYGTRQSQLRQAAAEIIQMDADIVALQEVVVDDLNGNALADLLGELNAQDPTHLWAGVFNPRFSVWWAPDFENHPAQRQAFVWRRTDIEYVGGRVLLQDTPAGSRLFASGRLPLLVHLQVNTGETSIPLYLVNLHLKCCTGSDFRRMDSMSALLQFLNTQYYDFPDMKYTDLPLVILGDFNVADRGGAYGEIAEWGFYNDNDRDGDSDFFHAAGSVKDVAWWDIDHIMFSDELSALYQKTPASMRNQIPLDSAVSDHDPVVTRLSWEFTEAQLDGGWQLDHRTDYTLVWADEFALPDGSAPDPANWVCETGGSGWGNFEEQYYTESADNVRIENGHLVIELHEDTANLYPGNDYTSGRLKSKDRQAFTYGRIEARLRLPFGSGSGLWPAFWMLGANFDEVGWPDCGEIDIMEYISREPNQVFGTIHGPGYAGGGGLTGIHTFGGPAAPPTGADPFDPQYFHVYAIEWEPNEIRWYVDDVLTHTVAPEDVTPEHEWVFDHDHFIILNLAIGGLFGGEIDARSLDFPTRMLVDYVRVYQLSNDAPPPLNLLTSAHLNDTDADGFADPGETVELTYTLNNHSVVHLNDVTIDDPLAPVSVTASPPVNMLINGGFELSKVIGWNTNGALATWFAHAGSQSLQLAAGGNYSAPAASQRFAAAHGEEFELSGYLFTNNPLPADNTFGVLKIVFQDAAGNDLIPQQVSSGALNTSDFPGAESLPFLNASQPVQTWVFSRAKAVAPPDTAWVVFLAINVDQSPATIYFDSVTAVHTNAPASVSLPPRSTDTASFTASYTLSEADINRGWVESTAAAAARQIPATSHTLLSHLALNPTADTDGDGIGDLLERAFGMDIFNKDAQPHRPTASYVTVGNQRYLQMNYRRRAGGSGTTGIDYSIPGLSYRVATSTDLQTWSYGSDQLTTDAAPVDNGDGTESIAIRTVEPIGDNQRFLRLEVRQLP
jgi:beta-glucanase (GH16 family)